MSASTVTAVAGTVRRSRHGRGECEGPTREALTAAARRIAAGLRRDVRSHSEFDRRMHLLDLHHRDPQLFVEVALVLAETAPLREEER